MQGAEDSRHFFWTAANIVGKEWSNFVPEGYEKDRDEQQRSALGFMDDNYFLLFIVKCFHALATVQFIKSEKNKSFAQTIFSSLNSLP